MESQSLVHQCQTNNSTRLHQRRARLF